MTEPRPDPFPALADPTRREILGVLRQGRQPVNAIAGHFDVSRPAISRHLRVLREAGLVAEIKVGRQRFYCLEAAPLREVDRWLEHYRHLWQQKLRNLKRYVERKAKEH